MEKDLSEKWLPRHMKDISASPEVMNHHMIELQPTKKEQAEVMGDILRLGL